MNRNERNGAIDQAKGKIKQAVGKVTDDPDLEAEGGADEVAGKIESTVGKGARKGGEAVERVGKALKG